MANYLRIDSVGTYFKIRGTELMHPLVGILDFYKWDPVQQDKPKYDGFSFDCYAIFLKDNKSCKLKYGGGSYDFDEGTMVFISPGQSIGFSYDKDYTPRGYALLFHPDLLANTHLSNKINRYNFFSYAVKEALHISAKERRIVLSLLEKIQFELEQNLDKHSKQLLISNLELLLNYCLRFYDRQFITRELPHTTTIEKFNQLLSDYFLSEQPRQLGLPTVSHFADQLNLSSNYFGDLVKKEAGVSAQVYIQSYIIEIAKDRVSNLDKSVSEVAYELGFKYPQHFTRLFKKKVGFSPSEYRASIN